MPNVDKILVKSSFNLEPSGLNLLGEYPSLKSDILSTSKSRISSSKKSMLRSVDRWASILK